MVKHWDRGNNVCKGCELGKNWVAWRGAGEEPHSSEGAVPAVQARMLVVGWGWCQQRFRAKQSSLFQCLFVSFQWGKGMALRQSLVTLNPTTSTWNSPASCLCFSSIFICCWIFSSLWFLCLHVIDRDLVVLAQTIATFFLSSRGGSLGMLFMFFKLLSKCQAQCSVWHVPTFGCLSGYFYIIVTCVCRHLILKTLRGQWPCQHS